MYLNAEPYYVAPWMDGCHVESTNHTIDWPVWFEATGFRSVLPSIWYRWICWHKRGHSARTSSRVTCESGKANFKGMERSQTCTTWSSSHCHVWLIGVGGRFVAGPIRGGFRPQISFIECVTRTSTIVWIATRSNKFSQHRKFAESCGTEVQYALLWHHESYNHEKCCVHSTELLCTTTSRTGYSKSIIMCMTRCRLYT